MESRPNSPTPGNRRMHVSMSVRGAIGLPDSELKCWVGNFHYDDNGEPLKNVREIRLALAEALAEGYEYIRNTECDNFDPKRGCLGHPPKGAADGKS